MIRLFNQKSRYFAHRGLHEGETVPENTIPSFIAAMDMGIPIELDVQLTKDRRIIVFHDKNLERLCDDVREVKDCTYKELAELKIYGKERIPLLSDVLSIVDSKVLLLIEVKNNSGPNGIEVLLKDLLSSYKGEFAIQSFDILMVRKVKRLIPGVTAGNLLSYKSSSVFSRIFYRIRDGIYNALSKPDFLSCKSSIPEKLLKKYRERIAVFGWTIRDSQDLFELQKKFDGLIFEGFIPDDLEVRFQLNPTNTEPESHGK